jgi:class 3 adenylate cyclase/Tfp pilus assembly protein PilF
MPEPIRQLVAIMFTDIVGYTALMGEDSQKALELIRINKEIQIPLVEKHKGKWVKEMGDGSLSYFNSALDAVNCAIDIQETARTDLDAKLRIGVHLGDVTIQSDDVYGDGVNIASRLESLADAGGIYISDATKKASQGQSDFKTIDLGELKLKNVTHPVRTFAIQGDGLPVANKKSKLQKLRESRNYGIIIILLTLIIGFAFREILSFGLIWLNITPVWSEIFLYTILLFLPTMAALLFIPTDKNRILRISRKLIPPVNVIAAVITLVIMFWGRELGAMTSKVTYADDLGNSHESTVLKDEFVKRVILFPFELKSQDNENSLTKDKSWLGMGIASAISGNMRQYQSVKAWVGPKDLSMKEQLETSKYTSDYLMRGKYEARNDSLVTSISLYNRKGKIFFEQTFIAKTLFEMSDIIKRVLISQLDFHVTTKDQADLPFTAFVTDNEQAFRHLLSGNNNAAIKADPEYAYAYLQELTRIYFFNLGDDNYKRQLAENGLKKMNKLPERDQLQFRAFYFLSRGEKDKALQAYERYVEFNPGDDKVLKSFVRFLANNGYYEKAIEICQEQRLNKISTEYGRILYRITLAFANHDELDQAKKEINKRKFLLPESIFLMVQGEIDMARGNLLNARSTFDEILLEKPLYYTIDSLLKVIDYLEKADQNKLDQFRVSITGTYLTEHSEQRIEIKLDNDRLTEFWGGQLPHVVYPIDQNSTYRSAPYNNQYQERKTFIEGEHGQILKVKYFQQNSPDSKPIEAYWYKTTPELLSAMEAFRLGNYTKADTLFTQTLAYDSGYYFARNFIEAINFSKDENALNIPKLLQGKRFNSKENNKAFMEFTLTDGVFQYESGGPPHTLFPINEEWLMDTYNKAFKFKVSGNDDNLSIEFYRYDNKINSYQKMATYH